MKLPLLLVLLTAVYAQEENSKEDQLFWNRFLNSDGYSYSVPNKPPVKAPRPVPPPAPCEIDVSLGCKSSDETKTCKQLQRPNPACASDSGFSILQFQLDAGEKCTPVGNSQGAFCKDCANYTGGVDDLLVRCKNAATGADLKIEPSQVSPMGIFTVAAPVATSVLPNKIDCVYVEGEKTKIQQVIITTSGKAPLNLKEDFGSFTLLSCDAGPPGGKNANTCLETISYDIEIKNSGSIAVEVTTLDIDFEGVTTNLLPDIDKSLAPGESVSLSLLLLIDLCVDRKICAEVTFEAKPANGQLCKAYDKYCFQTKGLPPVPVKPPVPYPAPTKVPPVPYAVPVVVPTKVPPVPYAVPVVVPTKVPPVPYAVPYSVPVVVPTKVPPVPYAVPVVVPTKVPPVPYAVPYAVPVVVPTKVPPVPYAVPYSVPVVVPTKVPPVPYEVPVVVPTKVPPVPYAVPVVVPTKVPPVPYAVPVVVPTKVPPVPYAIPVVVPTKVPPVPIPVPALLPTVPYSVPVVLPTAVPPIPVRVPVVVPTAPVAAPKGMSMSPSSGGKGSPSSGMSMSPSSGGKGSPSSGMSSMS
jgi:hypothetical protein